MSRLGGTGPAPSATAAGPAPPAGPAGWTQLELRAPGDSRHFDARHWAASRIGGEALDLTRRIASELAATRGWNARILIQPLQPAEIHQAAAAVTPAARTTPPHTTPGRYRAPDTLLAFLEQL